MLSDCHIHAALDGDDFRASLARHKIAPDEKAIRAMLQAYKEHSVSFLRDGGDRFGASLLAKKLAAEYGIEYLTPAFPIHRSGNYGSFIGKAYSDLGEYRQRVEEVKEAGGDFIKLMLTGLLDFDNYGCITGFVIEFDEIRELVKIAHGEGFSVMAHVNGDDAISMAVIAGVDSIEHGYYGGEKACDALCTHDCLWVPTLAPIANPIGTRRFSDDCLKRIVDSQLQAINCVAANGGEVAPGSDAGAFCVYHGDGAESESMLLKKALGSDWEAILKSGTDKVRTKFRPGF